MEYNLLENLQACREVFESVATLIYYTHLPPAFVTFLFGVYVAWNRRDRTGMLLSAIAFVFSAYVLIDLALWSETDKGSLIMWLWSLLGLLSVLLFFFIHWFVHSFITDKALPIWMSVVWLTAIAPVAILTPTSLNLESYDLVNCAPVEGVFFTNYYYAVGVLAMFLIAISAYTAHRNKQDKRQDKFSADVLVVIGAELFTFAFLTTGVIISYLVTSGVVADYGLEQYGIATMAVFIGMLTYATVRYHAFNLKLLAAQALVISLVVLISAEFLYVQSETSAILVSVTLGLAIIFGYLLVKSVKQEVRQRELIEAQEKELEVANKQQENLLHFISHEVKGYLTQSEVGFASIAEGDYEGTPPKLQEMAQNALKGVRRGVRTVMEILDASNLKKGTVSYKKDRFDLKEVVRSIVSHLQRYAEEKHLAIDLSIGEGSYMMEGDEEKIKQHVVRNLIDNAIKYTPKGTIDVKLTDGAKLRFSVKDSGIGITPEDKKNLFTEGGHGKDSIKVNVHSTGYGLFIAKQVVDMHGGKIWAESEGQGKGSTFIIEFPIK